MLSNYPPGVSGNEFQIAGPDYEEERDDVECPNGHSPCLVVGFHYERWGYCMEPTCEYYYDISDLKDNSFELEGLDEPQYIGDEE